MATVIVLGGSVAGLSSAMMLTRAGHQVTVLERDGQVIPAGPLEAAGWRRPTIPQFHQAHALPAEGRRILADLLPDVLDSLLAHGAREFKLIEWLPSTAENREQVAAQPDLVTLGCRRTTLEWVLRTSAAREPGLRIRTGVVAAGLIWEPGTPPRAVGVRTRDGADLRADLVIDATGRRSELPQWAREVGVDMPEWRHDCATIPYTRFYRLRDPDQPPPMLLGGATLQTLDGCGAYGFLADNGTVAIALGRHPRDDSMAVLSSSAAFDAAVSAVPLIAPLANRDIVEPISDVAVMAGLRSVLRPGTHNGAPLLAGVIAIGDAYATTNPLFGRGMSLALRHAAVVVDTLWAYPALGPESSYLLAHRLFDATHPAWYDAVRHDDQRTRTWCSTLGIEGPEGGPIPGMSIGVAMGAAFRDADIYIRMLRAMQLLDDPTSFFDDAAMANRIAAMNPTPPPGPTRADLIAAIERQRRPVPDASLR